MKTEKLGSLASLTRLCALLIYVFFCPKAQASESQFAFVYTTDLLPKGEKEIEQWATWRSVKGGGSFNLLEGRTAFEYGLSDDFQVAFYTR